MISKSVEVTLRFSIFHFSCQTPRGPTEFQNNGSKRDFADTTYAVLYLGGRYLDRSLEVFNILKIYQNKVESFPPLLSQSS